MTRAEWRDEREERQHFARSHPTDAARFRSWSFARHPELLSVAVDAIQRADPAPTRSDLVRAFGPSPKEGPAVGTRREHESTLGSEATEGQLQGIGSREWCTYELDRLGREVDDRERSSWDRTWRPNPEKDTDSAAIWTALTSNNPWGLRERCEALWLSPAMSAFAGVLAARDVPADVREGVLDDLREAFFYRLLGDGQTTPGWIEIATRLLETVGPVLGPASTLSDRGRQRAGHCVAGRARWGATLASVFANIPDKEGRALALRGSTEDPAYWEALLDLHVALRFLDVCPTDRKHAWRLVTQNRGKARGRLRAVVGEERAWLPAILALDALHARTEVAVSRFAWSWAWQEMSRGFSFDAGRPTTPPCETLPEGLDPLDDDAQSLLFCWVLLVALKGRISHLERWVYTGGTGDRDSTWARLLTDLPQRIRDPDGGYKRVRIHLGTRLTDALGAHRTTLSTLAAFPINRHLKKAVLAVLEPIWHPELPMPRAGFPTFVENAAATLAFFEEDPCRQDH